MHRQWIERVSILSWRWGLTSLTAMAFSSQYMTKRGITPSYTHICGISASCWNEILFTDPIPQIVSSHGLHFHLGLRVKIIKNPCREDQLHAVFFHFESQLLGHARVSMHNYRVCGLLAGRRAYGMGGNRQSLQRASRGQLAQISRRPFQVNGVAGRTSQWGLMDALFGIQRQASHALGSWIWGIDPRNPAQTSNRALPI